MGIGTARKGKKRRQNRGKTPLEQAATAHLAEQLNAPECFAAQGLPAAEPLDYQHLAPDLVRKREVSKAYSASLIFEAWLRRRVPIEVDLIDAKPDYLWDWLDSHPRRWRVPVRSWGLTVELLRCWVEVEILARLACPDHYVVVGGPDVGLYPGREHEGDADEGSDDTDDEAAPTSSRTFARREIKGWGLDRRDRDRKNRKKRYILPGCEGHKVGITELLRGWMAENEEATPNQVLEQHEAIQAANITPEPCVNLRAAGDRFCPACARAYVQIQPP